MEKIIKEHTFFDEYFRNEIIIVDLGACLGEFSNEMDNLYKVKKSILVEANPTNFNKINKKENYVLYNKIIHSKSGDKINFLEDPKSPYNGTTMFNYFNPVKHVIETISLEDIIKENDIDYIDILKIDIEGGEYDLMSNLSDEIFNKIGQITIEFHDFIDVQLKEKTKQIIDRIHALGFSSISKPIKYMNNSDNYDVIFFKK